MNNRLLEKVIGAVVFLISTVVFVLTVQPSVSFWDCGEFIAAAYSLQVPHPPGAPFFLLIGRVFSMIPFVENIALRINYVSILSSSFSVLFLYLIINKTIRNYAKEAETTLFGALTVYISAAIGALSLSFSDTFWFNAVEAEVYAASTFLLAAVTYLAMRWNERAENPGSEKYLILIAYLIGLSTGIHLMSVLAIVSVVMIVMFKKYMTDEELCKDTAIKFLIHASIIVVVAMLLWGMETLGAPPSEEEYQAYDRRFLVIMALISVGYMAVFFKKIKSVSSFYAPIVIGGIALVLTYPGVVKYFPKLMMVAAGDNLTMEFIVLTAVLGGIGYLIYYSVKNNKATLHLIAMSFLFVLLGFSTYTMVIIRANMNPPMNENEPDNFTELVSYLGREQYGNFPTFKRRFTQEPHQTVVYNEYKSDLDFWWRYQMNHMMTRYLVWNYVGRTSTDQDAGADMAPLNFLGFLGKPFNIHFSEGPIKNSLFAVPFLLGLLGIYFHFKRDWKMASVFMVLFVFMGYLTAYYQNQQQPQPRERDYFYVGAFFVYSLWIGLGVYGIAELVREKIKEQTASTAAIAGVLFLGILFVPARMLQANYHSHDRSANWVPWDYAYNMLQSVAPNAILFTNGDNDTFPLWYMQDVEGVRRDVRIANLSLLNTSWYIRQLKNLSPYGAQPVKMALSDLEIEQLRPVMWDPRDFSVPVNDKARAEFGITNESTTLVDSLTKTLNIPVQQQSTATNAISWRMNYTIPLQENSGAVRVQDLMVLQIVQNFGWERPVYFAVTCSEDSRIGLDSYLRMEGMAFRLVPFRQPNELLAVNEPVLRAQLYKEDNSYSKEYKPGFLFRTLNDSAMYLDENHIRLTQNYRNSFIRLHLYYKTTGEKDKAIDVLDQMERKIPVAIVPMDYRLMFDIGRFYRELGANDKANKAFDYVVIQGLDVLKTRPTEINNFNNAYYYLMEVYKFRGEYTKALDMLKGMQTIFGQSREILALQEELEISAGLRKPVAVDTSKKGVITQ